MANLKATFERARLLEAVKAVAAVVGGRTPKPILENVCLSVGMAGDADGLPFAIVSATNLDIGIKAKVGGEITAKGRGAVLIGAKRLLGILSASTGDTVSIAVDDNGKAVIRCDGGRFSLPTADVGEFPVVEMAVAADADGCHVVDAGQFAMALERVAFAGDSEASHYALGGVLVEGDGDSITVVATDGRRLAMQQIAAECVSEHVIESPTVIPKAAAMMMKRAAKEHAKDGEVASLTSAMNAILFECGDGAVKVYARLLEGRYPNWRAVFPDEGASAVLVSAKADVLLSTVQQAAIVTSDDRRGVTFAVKSGEKLVLTADGAEAGTARVEASDVVVSGEIGGGAVRLDPRYVVDFLKAVAGTAGGGGDEECVLAFRGPEMGAVGRLGGDGGYGYVVMPLSGA